MRWQRAASVGRRREAPSPRRMRESLRREDQKARPRGDWGGPRARQRHVHFPGELVQDWGTIDLKDAQPRKDAPGRHFNLVFHVF